MMHCDSVKYAVLASCAANKCILSNDRRYQHHALVYYSRAVRGVNQAVLQLHSRQRVPDDSLLATVVFLYLHDVRRTLIPPFLILLVLRPTFKPDVGPGYCGRPTETCGWCH